MKICYQQKKMQLRSDGELLDFDMNKCIDMEEMRKSFNDAIGQLGTKLELRQFLFSRICERNVLFNDIFCDYCYINLIEKMALAHPNIVVSTNNYAIYRHFRKYKNAQANLLSIILFQLSFRWFCFSQGLKLIKSLFESLLLHRHIKKSCKQSNSKRLDLSNTTIIQTWVADDNFSADVFRDSYYNGLQEYLIKNNRKCVTWPIFYNIKNVKKAIQYIRKNNDCFVLPEDYLKLSDYLLSIKRFLYKKKMRAVKFFISGKDFSGLFYFYLHTDISCYAPVAYNFIKRIGHEQFNDVIVIQNHENMVVEKAVLLARDEFCSNLKVWGYFHTTKPRNQLCLEYATQKEYEISPKPDKIIFNSPKFCRYYSEKYPELNCHNGYAFKQAYFDETIVESVEDSYVLVFLSGNMADSLLVVETLNRIAEKTADFHFIFRFHPMNIFELGNICKLQNYSTSQAPLPGIYSKVKKVISSYSACLIEAALAGKNVGFIYNKQCLLLNPFDDTGIDNYELIADSDELFAFLKRESDCSSVSNFFNTDRDFLSVFLPK